MPVVRRERRRWVWREESDVEEDESEEDVRGGSLRARRLRNICNTRETIWESRSVRDLNQSSVRG